MHALFQKGKKNHRITGEWVENRIKRIEVDTTEGCQKLPQSGWARPKISLLVLKSGRATSLFNKDQAKREWVRAHQAPTPLLHEQALNIV